MNCPKESLIGNASNARAYRVQSRSGLLGEDGEEVERLTHRLALRSVAAFVAHEINHPLGTIANLASLLERRIHDPVIRPSELTRHLEAIMVENRRAADVVKQLRILAGGLRGHIETIDCTEFLKEASARLRRRFLLNLVGVRVECRDRALTIEAAPDLLHIVLYNLLINGVEAALRANIEKPRLILRAKQPSTNSIVIEVIDNGPGIDVNLKDRIFEPFVSGTAGGSGLGLAICRDVMEWHGGGITFEDSVPRIGAKISLTLPLKERGGA